MRLFPPRRGSIGRDRPRLDGGKDCDVNTSVAPLVSADLAAAPESAHFATAARQPAPLDNTGRLAALEAAYNNLTKLERIRIDACYRHIDEAGVLRFDVAAADAGCHRDTISSTWYTFQRRIGAILRGA